eukprot:TRINITY_DN21023_c0_g2_i1.p1 TRINITY_DN21023_c0_g2~~TRINITY_DN21023_c0_g2_i1.p1  ORF type:complete len:361 (+),score=24.29 TRINITY_DN21023_c0_g2_i1:216-1298(+)
MKSSGSGSVQHSGSVSRRPESASSARRSRPSSARPLSSRASSKDGQAPQAEPWECPAPRAMRPSSACSSASSARRKLGPQIGDSPWVPSIGGGIHSSYSAIGQPQTQPTLADPRRSARSTPCAPAMPPFEEKVAIPSSRGLTDERDVPTEPNGPERRLTFCPQMRAKGYCRLPSCRYVHEVCRKKREFEPLYCAKAPRNCIMVPCRFFSVLGMCPHGENCVYSHDVAHAPVPPASAVAAAAPGPGFGATPDLPKEDSENPSVTREPWQASRNSVPSTFERDRSTSSVSTNAPRDPKYCTPAEPTRPARLRSASRRKPKLPQMGFIGWNPDLGDGGKSRPLSGRVAVLDLMVDRRVTVTAG